MALASTQPATAPSLGTINLWFPQLVDVSITYTYLATPAS